MLAAAPCLDLPRQPSLFPLPEARVGSAPLLEAAPFPGPFLTASRPLWFDITAAPPLPLRALPGSATTLRSHLQACFDPDGQLPPPFGDRTHEGGQQLLPLLRRVSYTQALIDGAFQLYLEYRACDKLPHFRLLWGHLLWGRVDIRAGNTSYGADVFTSPALPYIQARLADYLIALGWSRTSARLVPHESETLEASIGDPLRMPNEKTDTREPRLFTIDVELERRQAAQRQKQAEASLPSLSRPAPRKRWHYLEAWGGTWPRWMVASPQAI